MPNAAELVSRHNATYGGYWFAKKMQMNPLRKIEMRIFRKTVTSAELKSHHFIVFESICNSLSDLNTIAVIPQNAL